MKKVFSCHVCGCEKPPYLLWAGSEKLLVKCPNPLCGHIGTIFISEGKETKATTKKAEIRSSAHH